MFIKWPVLVLIVALAALAALTLWLWPGEPPSIRISVGERSIGVTHPKSVGPITVTIPGGYEWVVVYRPYHESSPWRVKLGDWLWARRQDRLWRHPAALRLEGRADVSSVATYTVFRHPATGDFPTQPLRGYQVIRVRVGRWTGVWMGTPRPMPEVFRGRGLKWY